MSVQFSHQFHSHWLQAPASTRRKIKDDLSAIIELLRPETALPAWQKKHGIYHTDTSKAEQVSLFSEESTQEMDDSSVNNDYGFAKSSFLKNVTAGMGDEEEKQVEAEPKIVQKEFPEVMIPEQTNQGDEIRHNSSKIATQITTKIKQVSESLPKVEPSSETPITQIITSQPTNVGSDTEQAFLKALEEKVDDYLVFTMQNIKKDIMEWVQEELATNKR